LKVTIELDTSTSEGQADLQRILPALAPASLMFAANLSPEQVAELQDVWSNIKANTATMPVQSTVADFPPNSALPPGQVLVFNGDPSGSTYQAPQQQTPDYVPEGYVRNQDGTLSAAGMQQPQQQVAPQPAQQPTEAPAARRGRKPRSDKNTAAEVAASMEQAMQQTAAPPSVLPGQPVQQFQQPQQAPQYAPQAQQPQQQYAPQPQPGMAVPPGVQSYNPPAQGYTPQAQQAQQPAPAQQQQQMQYAPQQPQQFAQQPMPQQMPAMPPTQAVADDTSVERLRALLVAAHQKRAGLGFQLLRQDRWNDNNEPKPQWLDANQVPVEMRPRLIAMVDAALQAA
jgi:hypothetical protein